MNVYIKGDRYRTKGTLYCRIVQPHFRMSVPAKKIKQKNKMQKERREKESVIDFQYLSYISNQDGNINRHGE